VPAADSIDIITADNELFEVDYKNRVYLKGKHIVLLYYLRQPQKIDDKTFYYIVINVENSPELKKTSFWKKASLFLVDLVSFPFDLLISLTMYK
jgi:hypothetical protein